MENTIPKKRMDEVLGYVVSKRMDDVRQLLIQNGVQGAASFNDQQLRMAFIKAIKDSGSFRTNLASYLTTLVQEKSSESFVQQPGLQFVQQPGLDFVQQPTLDFVAASAIGSAGAAATTTTTPTTTANKSSFWNTLGGLASKDNLQTLFNTGLTVAASSLTSKANKESEERALQLEAIRLQQIQAQKELAATEKKGLSTGAWIGIVLGVGAIVTTIILLKKKKN